MIELNSVLQKLRAIALENRESIEPPASAQSITNFEHRFKKFFNSQAPSELIELIKFMDGYEYNGLVIYGTRNSTTRPKASMLDLIEVNEIARDAQHSELQKIALIGHDSTSILAYEFSKQEFQYRDRIGLDRVESHDSLAHLLAYLIPDIED